MEKMCVGVGEKLMNQHYLHSPSSTVWTQMALYARAMHLDWTCKVSWTCHLAPLSRGLLRLDSWYSN